jgi:membrane fusion protein (multidrug efflux system)
MTKVRVISLLALGVMVAGGAGYWAGGLRKPSAPAPVANNQAGETKGAKGGAGKGGGGPVPVELTTVSTAAMPQTITAVGSLRSDESVMLRPEVSGRITAIEFQEGQQVTKGSVLIRLDPAVNLAEVQQTRANLGLAKSKYERAVDLSTRNFISSQARDEAKNTFEVAQAAAGLAEARLAKTEIKAPFSGIIGLRVVSIGDYVREGLTDLVNLEAIDPIKVDFRIPEMFLSQVKVGQSLDLMLDALPGKTYSGRVTALNPLLDAAGRALVIRAQVKNPGILRPGMFARVSLITNAKQDALVVPEEALVPQGSEQFLFRVIDDRAERVRVVTGLRRDGKVEIISGVEKDNVIVLAGQTRLRDGSAVRAAKKGGTGEDGAKQRSGKGAPPVSKS